MTNLNVLQLGLHNRAVLGCLDGFALHIVEESAHVVQLRLGRGNEEQIKVNLESKTLNLYWSYTVGPIAQDFIGFNAPTTHTTMS